MSRFVLLIFGFVTLQVSIVKSANYYWETTTPPSAVLLRPNPDELEDNTVHLYLCRPKENFTGGETWLAGQLDSGSNQTRCMAGSHTAELVSTEFQMLIARSGTTSWIPNTRTYPESAILSGTTRVGHRCLPCRAKYENSLFVGGPHNGINCYVAYGGRELSLTNNIELLVVNAYGVKLDEAGI